MTLEPSNEQAASSDSVSAEDTEAYIEAYHAIAEWIRFADAKAAVVLTVAAALAGLLVPTVKPILEEPAGDHLIPMWQLVVVALFAAFIAFLLLSGLSAFRCILPYRVRGRHPAVEHCHHFHPAAVAERYGIDDVAQFTSDCNVAGVDGFRNQVIAAILLDSHISSEKYRHVTRSIQLIAWSALFAFLYLLAIQL
jgi:hypothetical protein